MDKNTTLPFPPGSRLVAYLRDSGGDRQDMSVEQQENTIGRWCQEHGYILTRVFRDVARSGTKTAGRDQFLEMIEYLSNTPPEVGVVFWEYARLSRHYDDLMFYVSDLRRRGVILYSISDQVPEGLDGRLMESIQAWKNAKYVEDMRRNIKRGMRHIIITYHAWTGQFAPAGYKREQVSIGTRRDGSSHVISRLTIDQEKAPLVRRAFEMRANGGTSSEIMAATGLYPYRKEYIRMLRNEIYAGVFTISDGTRIENFCEPIVSRDLWQAVQNVNDSRSVGVGSNSPRAVRSSYLLSGLIYCSRCGRRMYGSSTPGRNAIFRYYRCAGADDRVCNTRQIPQGMIETAILDRLRAEAINPVEIARLAAEIIEHDANRESETRAAIDLARADLAKTQESGRRLVSAIADVGHNRLILDRLVEIERHEAELQRRIAELEVAAAPRQGIDLNALMTAAQQALDAADRVEVITAVRWFVSRVGAERNSDGGLQIEIEYRLPI